MHVFISRPSACFLGYFLFFSLTGRSFDLIQFIPRDENFLPLFCLHSQRNESSLLCTFSLSAICAALTARVDGYFHCPMEAAARVGADPMGGAML